jgi:hypothetical protein
MRFFDLFRQKREDLPQEVGRVFAMQERYLDGK